MQRVTPALAAALVAAAAAIPQDLPPGVLLLARVQHRTELELRRLLNISCLETVQREHQAPNEKMRPLDTIRLEVLNSGDRELFASPGDRRFSPSHPIDYAGSGAMGDGFFGLYLKTVLLRNAASTTYRGEEEIGGHRLARWDYRIPLRLSGQSIRLPSGGGIVGLRGSFWADPQSFNVVRLEVNAEDFPPTLPLTEASWSIEYAPDTLDGQTVLLPQTADFRMADLFGEAHHNRIEFTHCRVFGAQSAIRFDSPDAAEQPPAFAAASVDDTLRPLPAGLEIAVNLRTPLTADMAVGALLEGVVAANVPPKGVAVIPAGAPVRGRLRRLERVSEPLPHFVVAIEFTEVELDGIRHRFYAGLTALAPAPGVGRTLSTPERTETLGMRGGAQIARSFETFTLPDLPGVAAFFVRGDRLHLPPGFRTVWKTRALAP